MTVVGGLFVLFLLLHCSQHWSIVSDDEFKSSGIDTLRSSGIDTFFRTRPISLKTMTPVNMSYSLIGPNSIQYSMEMMQKKIK